MSDIGWSYTNNHNHNHSLIERRHCHQLEESGGIDGGNSRRWCLNSDISNQSEPEKGVFIPSNIDDMSLTELISISTTDSSGANLKNWLNILVGKNGILEITKSSDSSFFAMYTITNTSFQTEGGTRYQGYDLVVKYISGNNVKNFKNEELYSISYVINGVADTNGHFTATAIVCDNITTPVVTCTDHITTPLITCSNLITTPIITCTDSLTATSITCTKQFTTPLFTAPIITCTDQFTASNIICTNNFTTPRFTSSTINCTDHFTVPKITCTNDFTALNINCTGEFNAPLFTAPVITCTNRITAPIIECNNILTSPIINCTDKLVIVGKSGIKFTLAVDDNDKLIIYQGTTKILELSN